MSLANNLPFWRKDRTYYKGFTKGRDIHLFYKDNGEYRCEILKNFPFYFLIKYTDAIKNKSLIKQGINLGKILKIQEHPIKGIDRWVRIYVNKTFRRDDEFSVYQEPGEWNKLENLGESKGGKISIIDVFEKNGIQCFEADLSHMHRFLADYNINFELNLTRFYFDLETDDESGDSFTEHGLKTNRILSYSWYNDEGKFDVVLAKANTDSAEKELLLNFYSNIKKYDSMVAWNGANFDFKKLRFRMAYHGIKAYNTLEHRIIHCDLYQSAKRNAPSGEYQSFKLKNLGEKILKLSKIDLDKRRIFQLFKDDRELLARYNLRDAEILSKLEKVKSYFYSDVQTAALGNRFGNYYRVSTKVEGALLKESNIRGYHYKTLRKEDKSTYEGGYVKEPIKGLYDNIATFDFSSLYPSIIKTYNISHDTKVDITKNRDLANDKNLINTPVANEVGAMFSKKRMGIIPEILEELHKSRKYFEERKLKEKHGSEKFNYYYWQAVTRKTLILSFYGELGNPRGRFYDLQLARTITLCGQYYNKYTQALLKKKGYNTYYGDTDSVFVDIKMDDVEKVMEYVHRGFEALVVKMNAHPGKMKLGFENYYRRIIFTAKKRYAGSLIFYKGQKVEPKIHAKGFEIRRNDIPEIAKDVQNEVLKMLLVDDSSMKGILRYLLKIRRMVYRKRLKVSKLIVSQALSMHPDKYAKPVIDSKTGKPKIKRDGEVQYTSAPVHAKIAKKMLKDGKELYIGQHIPYIVTQHRGGLLGVHEEEYAGKYDEEYYWVKKTYAPVKRILEVAFPDFNWDKLDE